MKSVILSRACFRLNPLVLLAAGLISLGACSSPAPLPPIAAPTPPVLVKVPVIQPLPASMTSPCPEPPKRTIETDVQLLETADAFKVAMRCNAAKLRAIAAQPTGDAP